MNHPQVRSENPVISDPSLLHTQDEESTSPRKGHVEKLWKKDKMNKSNYDIENKRSCVRRNDVSQDVHWNNAMRLPSLAPPVEANPGYGERTSLFYNSHIAVVYMIVTPDQIQTSRAALTVRASSPA